MSSQYRWLQTVIIIMAVIGSVYISVTKPMTLGLDLQGGMRLILEAEHTKVRQVDNDAMDGVIRVLQMRIDGLGIAEPVIRRKGMRQIVIELAGIKDPDRARTMIGETALLTFVEAQWAPTGITDMTPEQLTVLGGENARFVLHDTGSSQQGLILQETVMTGNDLKWAQSGADQYGKLAVDITFTPEGGKRFYEVTRKLTGRPLAILLDGKVISAPRIQEPIAGGKAVISGQFDMNEMRDLVVQLKAGALPVPVAIVSETIVGPSLGKASLLRSQTAGLIGCGLLVVFMLLVYRLPGFVAIVALGCYGLFVLAILKLLNATLTLPGIAGFILTMGMAVDANVIIFERIKEEVALGQPILGSVKTGFARAFITIVDANFTTLVAAGVLFWLGSGLIKGFALTLTIGIIVSMITALIVTQLFLLGIANRFGQYPRLFFKGSL